MFKKGSGEREGGKERMRGGKEEGEGGRLATTETGSLAQQLAGFSALFLKLGEGRRVGGEVD